MTKKQIARQLAQLRATGFDHLLAEAARDNGILIPYFYAIASRETACQNILGDFRGGEYHGVGIVQIDIQHPIAREARDSGSWKTHPEHLLDFGAEILDANILGAQVVFPTYDKTQWLKIAASAYNCGWSNAIAGAHEGDSDLHTTGHNYGADVVRRMLLFSDLLASVSEATSV